MYRKVIPLFLLTLILSTAQLVAQNVEWAFNHLDIVAHTIDNNGDIFATGRLDDTTDFDPGPGQTVINSTCCKMHITKFSASGQFLWTKIIEAPVSQPFQNATPYDIKLDHNGNIIVGGEFTGTVDFDPGPNVNTITGALSSAKFAFVLKLNDQGDYLWAKKVEHSSGGSAVKRICTDMNGNIFMQGSFNGNVHFNWYPNVANTFPLFGGSLNSPYNFFVKYDSLGNISWAKSLHHDVKVKDIEVKYGKLFICGWHRKNIDVDPDATMENLTLAQSPVNHHSFCVKWDTTGTYASHFRFQTQYIEIGDLAFSSDDKMYLTGVFSGTVDLDPGPGVVNAGAGAAVTNAFLLKLDSNESYLWHQINPMGNVPVSDANKITINGDGSLVYTTVYANGAFDYNIGGATFTKANPNNFNRLIVSMRDSSGAQLGVYSFGEEITGVMAFEISAYLFGSELSLSFRSNVDSLDIQPSRDVYYLPEPEKPWYDIAFKLSTCPGPYSVDTFVGCNEKYIIDGDTISTSGDSIYHLRNAQGCDSLVIVNLDITNIDAAIINLIGPSMNAAGWNFSSAIQWYDCDLQAIIPGETNSAFIASANGNYAVIISENNCSDTSSCVNVSTVGIASASSNRIKVYPVPVSESLIVSGDKFRTLQLVDVTGKIVIQKKYSKIQNQFELDVSRFETGVYFLQGMTWDENRFVKKVMVERK